MQRELRIGPEPIEGAGSPGDAPATAGVGALVTFLGIVRATEGGQAIAGLEYEAFVPMAEHQLHKLLDEMERRWPITAAKVIHRTGRVRAGEVSLRLEVQAAHRQEAWAASQWLLEELKRVVPIWKKPF